MKKNTKIISMAAATLLAVSPVVAGVVPSNTSVVKAANEGKSDSSSNITVTNPNEIPTDGTPYFVQVQTNGYKVVKTGSVNLSANTVQNVIDKISDSGYRLVVDGKVEELDKSNVEGAVYTGLSQANIPVSNNDTFNQPANTFIVNVTYTSNGKVATLPITVTPFNVSTDYSANPVITYNGNKYDHNQAIETDFSYVPVNGTVDMAAIQNAFSAVASSTVKSPVNVVVDTSKVNTAVAGSYPVTVTATNSNNKSTVLTFNLYVGIKGAKYQTVNTTDGNPAIVYSINGNSVSATSSTVNNGSSVPTFGTVTVNGTSYTRINGENTNQFVLTNVFNPVEKTETHTVMVDSRAYSKTGRYLGHVYHAYNNIDIVPTVVTINGKTYYKVANKDEYVRVTNITGDKRTLKHNAYIYWSSYRRTPGTTKMYKGDTVTTYGGQMKFKNGKKYYRIEGCRNNNKRYIKAVNFY